MKLSKLLFLLFMILCEKVSLAQPIVGVNSNLKLTAKISTNRNKYFIVPELKLLKDTQNVQIHKEMIYGNEANPLADCRFFLKKIIRNQVVNMYVFHPYHPDLDSYEYRKFTTKESLTDTIRIEDFIDLEPGQYVVSLELKYLLNGEEQIVYSDEASFFVTSISSSNTVRKQRSNQKKGKN